MESEGIQTRAWWLRLSRVLDVHGPFEAALYLMTTIAVIYTVVVVMEGDSGRAWALAVSSTLVLCLCVTKLMRRGRDGRAAMIAAALIVCVAAFVIARFG